MVVMVMWVGVLVWWCGGGSGGEIHQGGVFGE